MKKSPPNILVLGATGMLGATVYAYLSQKYPHAVWGTSRKIQKDKRFLHLSVDSAQKDLPKVCKKYSIAYVVNCIGILRSTKNTIDLITVNALFPHLLAELAVKYDFKLIHVSTDAVFSESSKKVYETTPPNPTDAYGMSKLLGEPNSENTITFRTSILGHDYHNKKGLLSWIDKQKKGTLAGYANQRWSGCTTLEFAQICEDIITYNRFQRLRKKSSHFHFAPVRKTTKYEIVKQYVLLRGIPITVQKQAGNPITRVLSSIYEDSLPLQKYESNIKDALEELLAFES